MIDGAQFTIYICYCRCKSKCSDKIIINKYYGIRGSESMRLGAILARAIAILLTVSHHDAGACTLVIAAHWIVITRVVLAPSTSCTIMPHQPVKADAKTHRVGRSALPAAVPSGSPSYGILVSTWRRMHSRHQSVSTCNVLGEFTGAAARRRRPH